MNVICFGDSNTYGYDPRSLFGEPYPPDSRWVDILAAKTGWNMKNEGINGQEIPDEPILIPGETDLLLIMLGTNNLLQFWTPGDTAQKMEGFLKSISLAPDKILLIAPPPMKPGSWVQDQELIDDSILMAQKFRDVCLHAGVHFADAGEWGIGLGADGVHFSAEGHKAFAHNLLAHILETIK